MSSDGSGSAPRSYEEFSRSLRPPPEKRESPLRDALGAIGIESALRMAVLPGWTDATWPALGLSPEQPEVRAALTRLEHRGLLVSGEQAEPFATVSGRIYELTSSGRISILSHYLADPARSQQVIDAMAALGDAIKADKKNVPDTIWRWAELASFVKSSSAVMSAFEERVSGSTDTEDVSKWIDAARPIANVLQQRAEGGLDLSIGRAGRRIDLLHRFQREEQRLKHFIARREQLDALRTLVSGPDDKWALHLIGVGGVGKTMLLRYLTVRLAESLGAAVARVDFDYMSADYPSYAPGELLWSFEEELSLRDRGGAARAFEKANRYLKQLHGQLAAGMRPATAESALSSPLLANALEEYIDALRSLPRVILVLDTCEELLRVRAGRSAHENIEATFRILTALHDGPQTLAGEPAAPRERGLPKLRVIFAGRRPLASSGAGGWSAYAERDDRLPQPRPSGTGDPVATGHERQRLPARDFLRLLPLRGFSSTEASGYLQRVRKVAEPLVEPILDRVPPDSEIADLDVDTQGGAERRYSPYDLALYADWATDDPPPSPDTIRAATPAKYVELRVLERLKHPALESFMPLLATVKHADIALLRALSDVDASGFASMLERLGHQEWSDERVVVRDGQPRSVYSVDEALRVRLHAYYRGRPESPLIARAADYLEQLTRTSTLGALDWTDFDATIRVLDSDPKRAIDWWQAMERRILEERGYEWLRTLLDQLFVSGNAGAERIDVLPGSAPESVIRALLLASLALTTLHLDSPEAAAQDWSRVKGLASSVPDPDVSKRLRLRARLGEARQGRGSRRPSRALWMMLAEWTPHLDDELLGSFMTPVELALDDATASRAQARDLLVMPDGKLGPVVLAEQTTEPYAWALAGRACALVGAWDESVRWFTEAIDRARQPRERRFDLEKDWNPPEDVEARIRLEAIHALWTANLAPSEVADRFLPEDAPVSTVSLDHDRLASLRLLLSGASGVPAVPAAPVPPSSKRRSAVHDSVAPLGVTAAVVRAAAGDVDDALRVLHTLLTLADRIQLPDLVAAQRATLRIAYRFRLAKEHPSSLSLLVNAEDFGQAWMLEAVAPILRPGVQAQSEAGDSLEWAHHRWRTQGADADAGSFYEKNAPMVAAADAQSGRLAPRWLPIVLDLREAELISRGRVGSAAPLTLTANSWYQPTSDVPVDPAFIARLLLRASVLYNSGHKLRPPDRRAAFADLESRLGVRNLALLAFDEGDALALRLPRHARGLLRRAHEYFKQSKDHVGMVLSASRMALVSAELGSREALAAQLKLVQWNWNAFLGGREQREQASLPSWENLVDIAETLAEDMLTILPSPDAAWRPWLFRIVVCLARLRMLEGKALPTAAAFDDVLSNEFFAARARPPGDLRGLRVATLADWPAEASAPTAVILPPAPSSAPASEKPSAPAPATAPASRRGHRLLPRLLWVSLGVSAAGVAAFLLYSNVALSLTSWLVATIDGPAVPTNLPGESIVFRWGMPELLRIPLIVSSLGLLLYYLLRLSVRSTSSSAPPSPLPVPIKMGTIEVETISRSPDVELSRATFRTRVELAAKGRAGSESKVAVELTVGGIGPYEAMSWDIGEASLHNSLRALSSDSELVMKVPDDLGGVCWESVFWVRSELAGNLRREATGFDRRTMPRPVADSAHVRAFYGNDADASVAQNAWSAGRPSLTRQRRILSSLEAIPPSTPDVDSDVVHLLGRVEESSAGAVFEFGPEVAPLRAIDVRERFPAIHLCILQGAPLGRFEVRRDGTRRDANVARWFAHDLHARGVPAVLVIPPLENRRAVDALSKLVELIGRPSGVDTNALLATVRAIRQAILDSHELRENDARETASDVCLYCIDRWTFSE